MKNFHVECFLHVFLFRRAIRLRHDKRVIDYFNYDFNLACYK